jgi:putative sigma-54 modulation protein
MQLTITGHHIDVTPALRSKVESKIAKLERHFDNLTDVHCVLTVEKMEQKAEATVHLSGGTIFADAVDEDMYVAVDALVDKLARQVIKHKEKLTDHHAREAGKPRYG